MIVIVKYHAGKAFVFNIGVLVSIRLIKSLISVNEFDKFFFNFFFTLSSSSEIGFSRRKLPRCECVFVCALVEKNISALTLIPI